MRNDLLAAIVSALNGSVTNMNNRNKLLADISLALGGTVTNIDNRNMLLGDVLNAARGGELFPVDDVVIFGASIMEQSFSGANQQIASDLYATNGATVSVYERATSGDNSTVMLSRLPDIITEFQGNAERTLFVMHAGGNDISQNGPYPGGDSLLDSNMRQICSMIKGAGYKLAMSDITYRIPPASNPSSPYNENIINPIISEFADIHLNLYDLTIKNIDTWFEVDGIHPNSVGEDLTRNYIVDNTYKRFSNLGPIPEPKGWDDVVLQFGLLNVYPDGSNEFSVDATKSNIKNVDLTVVDGASITLIGSGGHSDTFGRGNVNDPSDTSISLTNNSGLKSYTYKQNGSQFLDFSNSKIDPSAKYTVGVTASRDAADVRNNDVTVDGVTKVLQATASPAEIVEFTGVDGSSILSGGITVAPTGGTGFSYIGMVRVTKE